MCKYKGVIETEFSVQYVIAGGAPSLEGLCK